MNRNWLARTSEEAIEPELEICDPHHHLWDVETMFGIYDIDDLRIDTGAGHNVTRTVFIDCGSNYRVDGPEHLRPVGETEWVAARAARLAESPGARIEAIVSHVDLTLGAAAEEVLTAHVEAGGGLFRGIRHGGARTDDPTVPNFRKQPPAGLLAQDDFIEGAKVLAKMGLSFEAWVYHPQLEDVGRLAAAVPDLTIVLNHIGGPLGVGQYAGKRTEVLDDWRPKMAALATFDNISVKVGGIGMPRYGSGWENDETPPNSDDIVELWGHELRWCIDTFGPDHAMFESNFPVDGDSCSYGALWNAFKKLSVGYSDDERAALFSGTARRAYRI